MYAAGVKAFRDYSPVTYSAATGLYRTFRWGRHLELFFLDERSFRNAKATAACSGDLAPTAPQAVRDAFAALAPGLRNPVSQSCIAAIDDPSRTMLGARQYAAFTKAIAASQATWKVIVNEVPIQQYYALPYDRWEGYAAERERLLRFLQANVKNVVFLTTDTHANLVNEVRSKTLSGAPVSYGIWEVVTGPVATNTFAKEIDSTLGQRGAGTAIGALFFKPAPPNGLGMRCAALDTYSYAQVRVDAGRLTVAMKDAKGQPVREATGVACAPLVLTAR
jgi:alkaline phosphatase D